VLLDLADRAELRTALGQWSRRVDVVSTTVDDRPADVLLIRPDARIVWATSTDEPDETAVPALRDALTRWFGETIR
jgi:hypothetical protein